jgi:Iron-containing redox enzyme
VGTLDGVLTPRATTASDRLRRKVELVLPAFEQPGHLLLEHPRARELYPPYLTAGACVAIAMIPLMEAALARARSLADGDRVAPGLADYLERHIPEEMHDHEPGGGAFEDLRAVGVDTDALLAAPPQEKIAALIGTQYFWIMHTHPVAILGFLWLEAYPPHAPDVERLIEKTGLPRAGFRQLLLHSELDVRHGKELRHVLDSLPLEPGHERLIALSALKTIEFLIDAWLQIVADEARVARA